MNSNKREPTLIGDLMRQMGVIRSDSTVDGGLVCSLLGETQERCTMASRERNAQEIRFQNTNITNEV